MLSTATKFRLLHTANHAVALAALAWVFYTGQYLWLLLGLACFLWTGIVGVNVALHRYYSHQSFRASKFSQAVMLASSVPTSLGSPAMWCSVHRLHHTASDTDTDPHNPGRGILRTWFAVWPRLSIPRRFMAPFLTTAQLRWVHRNYFAINWTILILLLLLGIEYAGFIYALPAVGCFHGAAAIGVLPHLQGRWQLGYRRYEVRDRSHNNWLASVLALGEGWHNNHHANPGRWYQGETWWELDPPAWMIRWFFREREQK